MAVIEKAGGTHLSLEHLPWDKAAFQARARRQRAEAEAKTPKPPEPTTTSDRRWPKMGKPRKK